MGSLKHIYIYRLLVLLSAQTFNIWHASVTQDNHKISRVKYSLFTLRYLLAAHPRPMFQRPARLIGVIRYSPISLKSMCLKTLQEARIFITYCGKILEYIMVNEWSGSADRDTVTDSMMAWKTPFMSPYSDNTHSQIQTRMIVYQWSH